MTLKDEFFQFSWRVTSLHMIAYNIAGLLALFLMNYEEQFISESLALLMKPVNSPMVALGAGLQIIQGSVISIILFPFRYVFLNAKKGWLFLILLTAGYTLFSPQVAGPGTFEGVIYTTIPLKYHLLGLPEVFIYSVVFSVFLPYWYRHPRKRWNIIATAGLCLIFLMSVLGYLAAVGIIPSEPVL